MIQTKKQPNVYPGMLNSSVEFFAVESEMKFMTNSQVKCISQMPQDLKELCDAEIEKDAEVSVALLKWHPASKSKRRKQFLICRYGGLDFSADIDNNQFLKGDYWDCPSRGTCPFNGVICQDPRYNNVSLMPIDVSLMKALSTNLTNEAIADQLNLALGSFHKYKKQLYAKLGVHVQTKQDVALIAKSLNLI